jgi:hypothetical protein
MKLTELQAIARDTLSDFMKTMPDVPFTPDDIVIEFAPQSKMVERTGALCAQYVPDKILNETQKWELENGVRANALIGREQSAVIVRKHAGDTKKRLGEVVFHELMHIYCAKTEMDSEHFIDIYGSGHTPDEEPENKIYDGNLNAGYVVWSEFIAQYYALKYANKGCFSIENLTSELIGLLNEVTVSDIHGSKTAFAMVCSHLFFCNDVEVFIELLDEPDFLFEPSRPLAEQTRMSFKNCLLYIADQLRGEKPWKITEDFIATLGAKYTMFCGMNSIHLGVIKPGAFGA